MSTEEWGVGYDEGYMKGWNDAMDEKPAEASKPVAYIEHLEPVAWMTQARNFVDLSEFTEAEAKLYGWRTVYTTSQRNAAEGEDTRRSWIGLDDDERWNAYTGGSDIINLDYAKAIEAKLKAKNT